MTPTTLRNALILSLLVNVGVLAAVAWQRLQPEPAPFDLVRHLQLDADQARRWSDAEAPFLAYLRTANAAIGEHRNRLIEAIFAEPADRPTIAAEQAKIAELQGEQQRLLIDQLLRERDILAPQQRAKLARLLTQQPVSADSIEHLHGQ